MAYSQAVEKIKKLRKDNGEFDEKIREELRKRSPMTPKERREQVLNYCFGLLPEGSTMSRDELAKMIFPY